MTLDERSRCGESSRRLVACRSLVAGAALLAAACGRGCAPVRSETHLLPDGYAGPIVIVFGVPSGEKPQTEGSRTVYRIPSSGVLMMSTPQPPSGLYLIDYYYLRGSRTKIPDRGVGDAALQAFAATVGMTALGAGDDEGLRWKAYIVGILADKHDWGQARDALAHETVERLLRERSASSSAGEKR